MRSRARISKLYEAGRTKNWLLLINDIQVFEMLKFSLEPPRPVED